MSIHKKRVLSGIQPSGKLHLGNYFGMMSRMIEYQESNDLFCFIVNYHALTTIHDKNELKDNTLNAALDFLALGMDPEKSTFWVQSDVPQVTELTWLLSNMAGVGLMERSTSYKDKIEKGLKPHMGLFSYPVLMAADILLYGSDIVPVGKDQKQHLEITRDIAIKFNNTYGNILIIPEASINQDTKLIPGIDGQKMSKSYGNTIPIFAEEKIIKKAVMSILTDSAGINEPKDKDTPLFQIYSMFLDTEGKKLLNDRYDTPGLRYGDLKKELFEKTIEYFSPFREKRTQLSKDMDFVYKALEIGKNKASKVADDYITKIRNVMGLNY
ncbi:tryptophan--tRNA ligase [bacterium]|jgi:tryptophanyl-tRNA synthetase|nr:tryptophan--tRNA ligase [bacterium]MBT6776977.1 tryptophan--tRNA ligase [bacterium]